MLVTEFDRRRLENLVVAMRERSTLDHPRWAALEEELGRARVLEQAEVPADVVTMNSVVRLMDLDSQEERTITLSFPQAEGHAADHVSVLSQLGLALLGSRERDELEIPTASKPQRWRVLRVLYQPEAAGNFAR